MMSLRKVLFAPFLFKKFPSYKQCLCTYRVSYADNISNYNRPFPIESIYEDKIIAELSTLSTKNILITLENNKDLINGSHLIYALKQFQKLYKRRFFDQEDGRGLWDHANAKEICSVIDQNVDKLSVSESVKLLSLFRKMKAPGEMKVMESLCKHINDSLQDLSFDDFSTVSLVLKHSPESSLAKQLHSNLEKKFIVKVATEYDPRNINHIERALYFTASTLDNYKLIKLFIDGLNNYQGKITVDTAINILSSLVHIKQYPPNWLNLLERIQNILIEQVNNISTPQMQFILFLICEKCTRSQKHEFYNGRLFDVIVKKIIADDSDFDTAVYALKNLDEIRYVNTDLLNYVCAKFFEKINLNHELIQHEIFKIAILIGGLSVIKHNNVFFNDIKDHLLNNKSLSNCDYQMICVLTLHLIILDCYPTELLTKVFNDIGNSTKHSTPLQWTLCKIYQKIKTNPMYEGPLPSESQLIELKKCHYQCYLQRKIKGNDKILCYLEEGMGAPIYVKSNISSKLLHLIDYAVAFNEDGSPVPINIATNIDENSDSIEYIEDLRVPPGSQIVLIFSTPDFWYTRNTKQLKSSYSCMGETLEALSYPVVYINQREFDNTPEEEKVTKLMSQIRSKLVHN